VHREVQVIGMLRPLEAAPGAEDVAREGVEATRFTPCKRRAAEWVSVWRKTSPTENYVYQERGQNIAFMKVEPIRRENVST
jgi:hypothetical protein